MLKQHPLSSAFPSMNADDFLALKDSIENIGVQNPITLFEGMVIDGWHRYSAATELDMECPTVELGDVDPRDFVLAQNKARRHVTQAQLAMATTAVYDWKPRGDQRSAPGADRAKSTKELAEVAGVGVRSIEQAKAVQTKAAPEVVDAVKRGDIGLKKAVAIAQLPKDEQAAAITKPVAEIKKQAEPEVPEYDGPSEEELRAHALQEQADREAMDKLMESDDKLATAFAEIKRLTALNAVLESRNQGLMNEKNEAIRLVKSRDRQIAKLEAMLKEAA